MPGVAGLTYNFKNTDTNHQNGMDFHFDWGARTSSPSSSSAASSATIYSRSPAISVRPQRQAAPLAHCWDRPVPHYVDFSSGIKAKDKAALTDKLEEVAQLRPGQSSQIGCCKVGWQALSAAKGH